jgi:hypothetical protein
MRFIILRRKGAVDALQTIQEWNMQCLQVLLSALPQPMPSFERHNVMSDLKARRRTCKARLCGSLLFRAVLVRAVAWYQETARIESKIEHATAQSALEVSSLGKSSDKF